MKVLKLLACVTAGAVTAYACYKAGKVVKTFLAAEKADNRGFEECLKESREFREEVSARHAEFTGTATDEQKELLAKIRTVNGTTREGEIQTAREKMKASRKRFDEQMQEPNPWMAEVIDIRKNLKDIDDEHKPRGKRRERSGSGNGSSIDPLPGKGNGSRRKTPDWKRNLSDD